MSQAARIALMVSVCALGSPFVWAGSAPRAAVQTGVVSLAADGTRPADAAERQSAVGGAAEPALPIGLAALERLDQISRLRPQMWACQSSSHERNGRNQDWTGVLAVNGNEQTLMDVVGPGCVYRMWFTASTFPLNGNLRIYFDGATQPDLDVPLTTLFSGTQPGFPKPLVGNQNDSAGGCYCYVPMPFRTGCRITRTLANASSDLLNYYNITYHRYVTAEGVDTFSSAQDTSVVLEQWAHPGVDPKPDTGTQVVTQSFDLPARSSRTLVLLDGPATIQSFELRVPAAWRALACSSLWVRITWNNEAPAFEAPLGTLFGSGLASRDVPALPLGIIGERLYCYLPMPFRHRALVEIYNPSGAAVGGLQSAICYTPGTLAVDQCQLYGSYGRSPGPTNRDYAFLNAMDAAGHLVGFVQNSRGTKSSQNYLEGDERFYVEGSQCAGVQGTGTEDFYNGGWYFNYGEQFAQPLHGHPAYISNGTKSDGCYRFLLGELVPFRGAMRAGIEHGGWNEDAAEIESLTFYYKYPHPLLAQTDFLQIADPVSEAAHQYRCTGLVWSGSTTASYESNGDGSGLTCTGRWLAQGGTTHFAVSTYPCGEYVVLRRCLNYGVPNQRGDVYVDGAFAGTWYDAGSSMGDGSRNADSPMFRESEFFIPPALVRGKRSVDVRIVNTSPTAEWTEYYYFVQAVRTPEMHRLDFDADDDIDQEDFALIQTCISGEYIPQYELACKLARVDDDLDVDGDDLRAFLECMSGPGVGADRECFGE